MSQCILFRSVLSRLPVAPLVAMVLRAFDPLPSLSVAAGKSSGFGKKLAKQTGNVAEYVLPVMMVALAAFGVVTVIDSGEFVNTGGQSLFQADGPIVAQADGGVQVVTRALGKNPTLQTLSYVTERGNKVVLSAFPADMAALIEVVGADGTTETLLANIDALVAQLVAAGEMTEAEGNLIKGLSNKGYALVAAQKVLAAKAQACGEDRVCFKNARKTDQVFANAYQTLSLETRASLKGDNEPNLAKMFGQSDPLTHYQMTTPTMRMMLTEWNGFDFSSSGNNGWLANDDANLMMGNGLYDFLDMYIKAERGQKLSRSSALMLDYLSQTVLKVANQTQFAAYMASDDALWENLNGENGQEFSAYKPQDLAQIVADNVRHEMQAERVALNKKMSGQICAVGSGEAQETACK